MAKATHPDRSIGADGAGACPRVRAALSIHARGYPAAIRTGSWAPQSRNGTHPDLPRIWPTRVHTGRVASARRPSLPCWSCAQVAWYAEDYRAASSGTTCTPIFTSTGGRTMWKRATGHPALRKKYTIYIIITPFRFFLLKRGAATGNQADPWHEVVAPRHGVDGVAGHASVATR